MVTCARARGSSAPLRLLRAPLARRVRGAAAAGRARGSSLAPAAAAQQSPSAEADATNAAARAEEDRVKERAKQRTRKLRRDAKEEAEEELAECKKHIDTVLLEAQQELLATRGVEYLSSAQAPSPQQIAQDLREVRGAQRAGAARPGARRAQGGLKERKAHVTWHECLSRKERPGRRAGGCSESPAAGSSCILGRCPPPPPPLPVVVRRALFLHLAPFSVVPPQTQTRRSDSAPPPAPRVPTRACASRCVGCCHG